MKSKTTFTILLLIAATALQAQQQTIKWCKTEVIIPAVYDTTYDEIIIRPAHQKIICEEAVFKTVSEKVRVSDKNTYEGFRNVLIDGNWKVVECQITEPAKYQTVRIRKLIKPATTRIDYIPAETRTIAKIKMVKPPTKETVLVNCDEVKELLSKN